MQRSQRPEVQRLLKKSVSSASSTSRGYEDEKFSYLVVERPSSGSSASLTHSRIVRGPRRRGGHVLLDLCTPSGDLRVSQVVSRSHGEAYRVARKLNWGDTYPYDVVNSRESEASDDTVERIVE